MKKYTSIFIIFSFLVLLVPTPSKAATFTPGFIISDYEMFDTSTMTVEDVQAFLDSKTGVLKTYTSIDHMDGLLKTAAMIIHDAALRYGINPQYILTKLQKEQGLITNANPKPSQLDWAMGYAVCDTCSTSHPNVIKYKGFAKQVDYAASLPVYIRDNQHKFYFKVGQTYEISGQQVTVQNIATASLYNYTPHIHGNEIFWKLWQSWFQKVNYPDGSLLQQIGEPAVWLIEDGVRYPFANFTAFQSRFSTDDIIQVIEERLEEYPIGSPISQPNFALVRTETGTIYLLNGKFKQIIDEGTMMAVGFTTDELVDVLESELGYYVLGTPITNDTSNLFGSLLRDPNSGGVFFVQNATKYALIAPELLELNFSHLSINETTAETLAGLKTGDPVKIKDGLLVKSEDSPAVYVISKGYKLPIPNEYTFNTLGYNWHNIHTVRQSLLDLHPLGDPINIHGISTSEQESDIL